MEMIIGGNFEVTKILKKTKAEVFKNLEVGDILEVRLTIKNEFVFNYPVKYLNVKNRDNLEEGLVSITNFSRRIECFEWKQL